MLGSSAELAARWIWPGHSLFSPELGPAGTLLPLGTGCATQQSPEGREESPGAAQLFGQWLLGGTGPKASLSSPWQPRGSLCRDSSPRPRGRAEALSGARAAPAQSGARAGSGPGLGQGSRSGLLLCLGPRGAQGQLQEQLQREGPWGTRPLCQGLPTSSRGLQAQVPPALAAAGPCKGGCWGKSSCHTAPARAEPGTAITSFNCLCVGFCAWFRVRVRHLIFYIRARHRVVACYWIPYHLRHLLLHFLRKEKAQLDQMEPVTIQEVASVGGNACQRYG